MSINRVLLVGSSYSHTISYYNLIKDEINEIFLFTDKQTDKIPFKIFDFSLINFFSIPIRIWKLKKAIKEYAPDIIHIHQANSYAFLTIRAAKGLGIPIITTLWGSDVLLMPKRNILLRKMFQYIIENSNRLTADAKILRDEAEKYTPHKLNITIVNYGIEFIPISTKKENIIYSNRLHKPIYNIERIIKDFAEYNIEGNYKLIVGAVGEETEKLKTITKQLNGKENITFCGWLTKEDNIINYAKSKIYVSIPDSDGTAISLLEAMYYECLPIVSDLPANKEWIEDGKNGIIVSSNDENIFNRINEIDIEKAIIFNRNLIKQMGDKGVNGNIFLNLYRSLLQKYD
jgi:glycosyltransferase involved in cell wall biosynthesis